MMATWELSSDSEDELPSFLNLKPFKLDKKVNSNTETIILSDSSDDLDENNTFQSLREKLNKVNKNNINSLDKKENQRKVEEPSLSSMQLPPLPKKRKLKQSSTSSTSKTTVLDELPTNKKTNKKEQLQRKATQIAVRNLKPGECLKNISCLISRGIEDLFKDKITINDFQKNSEATFVFHDQPNLSVHWERKVYLYDADEDQDKLMTHEDVQVEQEKVIIIRSKDFITVLNNVKSKKTLFSEWLQTFTHQDEYRNLHLVCLGLRKYKRQLRNNLQKLYKNSVLTAASNNHDKVKSIEDELNFIEHSIVELQVCFDVNVILLEAKEELVNYILQTTKAIGEAPYKRMKKQNVQFINDKSSVKIDSRTGEGIRKAWKQMLCQFFNVSPEMSAAIITRFGSLHELMDAYNGLNEEEGSLLLSDIPIRRGVGTLESSRRLGPELSKRIYKMFTATDGSSVLF